MQKWKQITPWGLLPPLYDIMQHPGTRHVSQKQFVLNSYKAEIRFITEAVDTFLTRPERLQACFSPSPCLCFKNSLFVYLH